MSDASAAPAPTGTDLDAVRRVATLHGLEFDVASLIDRSPLPRPGEVIALAREAEAAARLYAQLSGRPFGGVHEEPVLSAAADAEVLVLPTGRLNPDLLLQIHRVAQERGRCAGLIIGRDAAALTRNAWKTAISLRAARTDARGAAYLNPYAPFVTDERTGWTAVGGGAEPEDARSLLGSGHAILAIETHADIGANAWLHPELLLCPNPPAPSCPTPALRPMCLDSGECYRFRDFPTRDRAWADGRLIAASALSAQALVLFGCALLRPGDGVMSPEFSVGAAVADEAIFGAAMLTWCDAIAAPDGESVAGLVADLARGLSAGEALAGWHASDVARAHGGLMCLLGDPAFALPTAFSCDLPRPDPTLAADDGPAPEPLGGDADFIERVLLMPVPAAGTAELQAAIHRSLAAADGAGAALDERIAELLSAYPWLNKYRGDAAAFRLAARPGLCPQCRVPVRTYDMMYHTEPPLVRSHLLCERCGAAWHRPAASEVVARHTEDGSFHVKGVTGEIIVQLVVETRDPRFRSVERHRLTARKGCAVLRMSNPPPLGPGFTHVHVISRDEIAHFAFRSRGGAELTIASAGGEPTGSSVLAVA